MLDKAPSLEPGFRLTRAVGRTDGCMVGFLQSNHIRQAMPTTPSVNLQLASRWSTSPMIL